MKLVILTKPTFFVEEDKILTTLFEEGMDDLHLYKPNSSPMYSERLLSLLTDNYYRKITVHDHYYLKNEYGLAKIHIDSPDSQLPKDYKGKYSRTCTDSSQIKEFKKKSEYIFLKSMLPQDNAQADELHPDRFDGMPIEQIETAAKNGLIDKHVYAYGNINLENIKIAKDLGFGGVVIGGDLWNQFDIHNEIDYKRLIVHFEKIRKAIS